MDRNLTLEMQQQATALLHKASKIISAIEGSHRARNQNRAENQKIEDLVKFKTELDDLKKRFSRDAYFAESLDGAPYLG